MKTVVCGYHHSFVITREGVVFGWGKNNYNQISGSTKEVISIPMEIGSIGKVIKMAAGWAHTLALIEEGVAYGWGYGKDGQLGLNDR